MLYEGPDDPELLLAALTVGMDHDVAERIKKSMRASREAYLNRSPIPTRDLRDFDLYPWRITREDGRKEA